MGWGNNRNGLIRKSQIQKIYMKWVNKANQEVNK